MATIHPTAAVDAAAELADDVEVGPFCIVSAGVRLGPGCRLGPRVSLTGPISAGRDNVFHPGAVLGGVPQDLRPAAPDAAIEIGDGNVFREGSTIHQPKVAGGVTRIGSRNRFHAFSHVGHDGIIGDGVMLGTHAVLGGHTTVHDEAWVEGQGGTHQFVTIGRRSLTRTHIPITRDVPPFMWVDGNHFTVRGVNPRFPSEPLERAFRTVWESGLPRREAVDQLSADASEEVRELAEALGKSIAGPMGRARESERT